MLIINHLNELWKKTRVEVEQLNRNDLVNLLSHAIKTVPFYSNYKIPEDCDLDSLLKSLPIVTKSDLQQNSSQFKSSYVPESLRPTYEESSSGSTGKPLTVLKTTMQGQIDDIQVIHQLKLFDYDLMKKVVTIRADNETCNMDSWGLLPDMIETGYAATLNSSYPVSAQFYWLLEEDPSYLMTFPTNLKFLLKYSELIGSNPPSIEYINTTGEPVSKELREHAMRLWGAKIVDCYSAHEIGRIAFQCPDNDENYHIQADAIIVEVLDENDEPCEPGEIGSLAITVLHSYAMPLIRYKNGDYAQLAEQCSCGCGWKTIKKIMGRTRNMITLPDGSKHWPSFPSEEWVAIDPNIKQFQLIQHDIGFIEIRIVTEKLSIEQEDEICLMLNRRLKGEFQYTFNYLSEIEIGKNGKFEDFISEVE